MSNKLSEEEWSINNLFLRVCDNNSERRTVKNFRNFSDQRCLQTYRLG